eukprot:403350394
MRPTDLKFRSIREKTPEHPQYIPVITKDGNQLFASKRSSNQPSLSTSMNKRIQSANRNSSMLMTQNSGNMSQLDQYFNAGGQLNENGSRPNNMRSTTTPLGFNKSCERFSIDHSNPLTQLPSTFNNQKLGPGAYQADRQFKQLTKKACGVKYQHLSIGQKLAASGDFHFEGDRLIYEPSYKDPRKKSGEAAQYQNLISRIMSGAVDPAQIENLQNNLLNMRNKNHYSDMISQNEDQSQFRASRNRSQNNHTSNSMLTRSFNKNQNISQQTMPNLDESYLDQNLPLFTGKKKQKKSKSPNKTNINRAYNYTRRPQSRNQMNQTQNPQNIIIFMGDSININPQNTFIINQPHNQNQTSSYDYNMTKSTNQYNRPINKHSKSPIKQQPQRNYEENANQILSETLYQPKLKQTFQNKKHSQLTNQSSIYRILASDSNVQSGYFQYGFQCPTQSSTFQRKKPIAYDLEMVSLNAQLQKRPKSSMRLQGSRNGKNNRGQGFNHTMKSGGGLLMQNDSGYINLDLIGGASNREDHGLINIQVKEDNPYENIMLNSNSQRRNSSMRYSNELKMKNELIDVLDENQVSGSQRDFPTRGSNYQILQDVKANLNRSAQDNDDISINPRQAASPKDKQSQDDFPSELIPNKTTSSVAVSQEQKVNLNMSQNQQTNLPNLNQILIEQSSDHNTLNLMQNGDRSVKSEQQQQKMFNSLQQRKEKAQIVQTELQSMNGDSQKPRNLQRLIQKHSQALSSKQKSGKDSV